MIYFTCERFYDYMDLELANIEIHWKLQSSSQKVEGISNACLKDVKINWGENHRLNFGWLLTDSITKYDGIIEFSIKFKIMDNNQLQPKILYELNTLPSYITILPTIDLNEIDWSVETDLDYAEYFPFL